MKKMYEVTCDSGHLGMPNGTVYLHDTATMSASDLEIHSAALRYGNIQFVSCDPVEIQAAEDELIKNWNEVFSRG